MSKNESTLVLLFGNQGTNYLGIFDEIARHLLTHSYTFVTEASFLNILKSKRLTISNQILSLELIDKAHLAATMALYRTKQWIRATCIGYDDHNFIAWAAGARGLVENTGDILDGLAQVPLDLATYHGVISMALAGRAPEALFGFSDTERDPVSDGWKQESRTGFSRELSDCSGSASLSVQTLSFCNPLGPIAAE